MKDAARDELIAAAAARACGRRMYAYDEDGRTYIVKYATRESQKFDPGELKLPPTAKAVCVEGDSQWTQLPDFMTIAAAKAMESAKRKSARIANAAKRNARSAAAN